MPKLVQFTHPGAEHKPDRNKHNHKSWNTGKHKRKFLLSNGKYIFENKLQEGNLVFWGEWEPPSDVEQLSVKPNKFYPQWIHKPYLPSTIPNSNDSKINYRNTDPCVFDGDFKYFVCKQYRFKSKSQTRLAKLERASVILFGSTGNQNKKDAFFQLDTVFVVSDYIEYDISDPNALAKANLGNYRDYVFKMEFPKPKEFSLKLRLYFGASFENQVEGMYSFSPAKVWNNQYSSFPRIAIKDLKYITNNLNAAPKISDVSTEDIKKFWNDIRDLSRENGCVEGVRFNYMQK